MKRSRHDNFVNGDVVKTGDKSSLHCSFGHWNEALNLVKTNKKCFNAIQGYCVCFTTLMTSSRVKKTEPKFTFCLLWTGHSGMGYV